MKTLVKTTIILFLASSLLTFSLSCSKEPDCTEQTWYQDNDGDGYGNPNQTQLACSQPNGFVADNRDCDDNNSNLPTTESMDGIDNDGDGTIDECDECPAEIPNNNTDDDCDGFVDECDDNSQCGAGEICINGNCETATTYYKDNDGDGFGDASNTTTAGNNPPNGYVANAGDCDDNDASINPNATEIPDNNIDEDCNGSKSFTFYKDNDGDTYGDSNNSIIAESPEPCNNIAELTLPQGYVFNSFDCDDSNASVFAFSSEIANDGIDNNCNNLIDEIDTDNDGISDTDETSGANTTDPNNADTDGDGLIDGYEILFYQTDPTSADTDGDGFSDQQEINQFTNPNDANSHP